MKKSFIFAAVFCLLSMLFFVPEISVRAAAPKLNKKKITVYEGEYFQLKLKNADEKLVEWEWSGAEQTGVVFDNGKARAIKAGEYVITAKYKNKGYKCNVTVKPVAIDTSDIDLELGKSSKIKVEGEKIVLVYATNREVATISQDGTVTAVGKGSTKVAIVTDSFKSATIKVTVREPGSVGSEVNCEELVLYKGDSFTFSITDDVVDSITIDKYTFTPLTALEIVGTDTVKYNSDTIESGTIYVHGKYSNRNYSVKVTLRRRQSEDEILFNGIAETVRKNGTNDGKDNYTLIVGSDDNPITVTYKSYTDILEFVKSYPADGAYVNRYTFTVEFYYFSTDIPEQVFKVECAYTDNRSKYYKKKTIDMDKLRAGENPGFESVFGLSVDDQVEEFSDMYSEIVKYYK